MRDIISIGLLSETAYSFTPHKHLLWEIIYYTYGKGVLTVGNENIKFSYGVIACQPPDIFHCESSNNGYRNIHFSVRSFHKHTSKAVVYEDTPNRDFYHILMQLYHEYKLKRPNWENIVEGLLNVLWQYMLAWDNKSSITSVVEQFQHILTKNIGNKHFALADAIKNVPLSEDHFRRIFKKQVGETPLQYLNRLRVEHAQSLLEIQGITIKEISNMVGFEDPYYFSRIFKKFTGKSPSTWKTK